MSSNLVKILINFWILDTIQMLKHISRVGPEIKSFMLMNWNTQKLNFLGAHFFGNQAKSMQNIKRHKKTKMIRDAIFLKKEY